MALRRQASAIVVGASTVDIDDPALTVRDTEERVEDRSPRRIVVSRTCVPNLRSRVFTDGLGCTLVTSESASADEVAALERQGVAVLRYAYTDGLDGALRAMATDGVNDVLVEAGPSLFSALWRGRLIDELVLVTAGGMSGNAAPPLFMGAADSDGADLAPVFYAVEAGVADGDAVTVWRPRA